VSDSIAAASSCDLGVVVLSWNTRDLLIACLESLEAVRSQLASMHIEILVVDNASTDGTPEQVAARFPSVRLIELPHNVGFARGMNAGIRAVESRFTLLLNSDTRVSTAAIARACEVLASDASIAAVGVQLLHPDGRLQNSVHAFPGVATEVFPSLLRETLLPRRFPSKRRPARQPIEVDAVLGAALFVRREAFARVGLLCEEYFFFLEDTDWCFRAWKSGLRIVHVPDAHIEHLSGGSSKRRDAARTRIEFHRSLYRFLRLHRGRATLGFVVGARTLKGIATVLGLGLIAPFSARQRSRLVERSQLLGWHLRGCPAAPSLADIGRPDPDGHA